MRARIVRTLFVSAGFAAVAQVSAAQGPCVYTINQSSSDFAWTAVTNLGTLVGDPNNNFELAGTVTMENAVGGNPASTGAFVSSNALVVPDIHGEIPNVFPFLPPLATVDITGLVLSVQSEVFVGSELTPGEFTATATLIVVAGVADVVPLVGAATNLDLAGSVSDPVPVAGTLSKSGSNLDLIVPINVSLPLDDPSIGLTGNFTLVGVLDATADLLSGCNTTFFAGPASISLAAGGAQTMFLDADATNAFQLYWIFGSASGTSPGLPPLPLNFDNYFLFTINFPNSLIANSLAFFDGTGRNVASITLPAGLDPGLAGVVLNHAYAAVDVGTLTTLFASNAKPLTLLP